MTKVKLRPDRDATFNVEIRDRVRVFEPGIAPWEGTAISIKWSSESGWWLDVRADDGDTWSIPRGSDTTVEKITEEGESDAG